MTYEVPTIPFVHFIASNRSFIVDVCVPLNDYGRISKHYTDLGMSVKFDRSIDIPLSEFVNLFDDDKLGRLIKQA